MDCGLVGGGAIYSALRDKAAGMFILRWAVITRSLITPLPSSFGTVLVASRVISVNASPAGADIQMTHCIFLTFAALQHR